MAKQKVRFKGASKAQTNWGANDDANTVLEAGKEYEVLDVEVHSWHTKYELVGFPGLKFNSVSFEGV